MQLRRKSAVVLILFIIGMFGQRVFSQTTYTWDGSTDNNWVVADNWTPVRTTPAVNDILTFSTGTTLAITIPANLNQTIGQLIVNNNTNVSIAHIGGTGGTSSITITNATPLVPVTVLDILSGSTLVISGGTGGTRTLTLGFGGTAPANTIGNIAGSLSLNINGNVGIFNTANSTTTVTGAITYNGGTITGTAPTLNFAAGSQYQHTAPGGTIPTATWNLSSTASITGLTGAAPAGLAQTFGNMNWNNASQTVAISFAPTSIAGNLTVQSTGTGSLNLSATPMTVGGNFTISGGSFNVGSGNILNVTGNVNVSSGTLELNSGTGTSTLSIIGNFTQSGGVITESGTGSGNIEFSGSGAPQVFDATISSGSVTNSVNYFVKTGAFLQMNDGATVVRGAGFTMENGSILGIRSTDGITLAPSGTGNIQTISRNYSASANYIYNGTSPQVTGVGVPDVLAGVLQIDNPGNNVTLSEPVTINGGSVRLLNGNLVANAPNTVGFGPASGEIIRTGGTMTADAIGGTTSYNIAYGGGSKTVGDEFRGGLVYPSRVNNVTVGLTLGASLTMWSGISFPLIGGISGSAMDGVLNFVSGKINTSLTQGLLLTENATVSGASSTRYVEGPLAKLGSTAFTFPVGSDSRYLPLAISGAAAVAADITAPLAGSFGVLVQPVLANPSTNLGAVYDAPLLSIIRCYYWDVTKLLGPVGAGVHIWPTIEPIQVGGFCESPAVNNANLRVAHYGQGTPTWKSRGAGGAGIVTQDGFRFIGSLDNIVTFSPFTVGSVDGALPVTFLSFTATRNEEVVKLNWETGSEQNSAYFNVERSSDGTNFSTIGKVNAAGNSSTIVKYNFTDNNPAAGRNFYRLRQVDLDAKFDYSKTVSLNMSAVSSVSIYPNPVVSNVMVEYPKAGKGASYKIISMDGRIMQSGILQENSTQQNISLGNLQRGQYILTINNNGQQNNHKLLKQ